MVEKLKKQIKGETIDFLELNELLDMKRVRDFLIFNRANELLELGVQTKVVFMDVANEFNVSIPTVERAYYSR